MAADIPFTTFTGCVKQLDTNFNAPVMRDLFEPCFAAARELDERYADLKRQGIESLVSAAGVEFNFGYRPRRFAGGPGLPSGRYFTLCDSDFNDRGTLRDEITAYYSANSGIWVSIFDPKVEPYVLDHLRGLGETEESLAYPLYLLLYRIERRTPNTEPILKRNAGLQVGKGARITYGVREFRVELDHVIDLREPDTQDWFVKTFVALELENERRAADETTIIFPPKQPIQSFGELLPVIASLETGGGNVFGQAVGHWLRLHGSNGLIFPSARSNAFNRVRDNRPTEWSGWNLVVYVGAEAPVAGTFFGRMGTWSDRDHDHIHVVYTDKGPERGSFSIRGLREFNLLEFDRKKQIACGVRTDDVVAHITGTWNAALSHAANLILDQERRTGAFWYQDIDYMRFVGWLERQWREPEVRE